MQSNQAVKSVEFSSFTHSCLVADLTAAHHHKQLVNHIFPNPFKADKAGKTPEAFFRTSR